MSLISPFRAHFSIWLKIGFWYGSFVWRWWIFNISALNWKTVLQFFEKRFSFSRKLVSRLMYRKHSIFPLIVIWKHAALLNGRLFWKSLVPFFRRTYGLSVDFKMKLLWKSVFQCYNKNKKLCERSSHTFLLPI